MHLVDGPALVLEQMQNHTGIDGPAPPSHDQTMQRRKAHAGGNAVPCLHGAHAGAVSKMGDHDPPIGARSEMIRQHAGDILVG